MEEALVERLPTKVWSWEAPALPGKTIGSSGARWLKRQVSTKLTPRRSARDAASPFFPSPASAEGPKSAAKRQDPRRRIRNSALTSNLPGDQTCRAKSDTESFRFLERFVTRS